MNKFNKIALAGAISSLVTFQSALANDELVIWEDNGMSYGIEMAARDFARENGVKISIQEQDGVQQANKVKEAISQGQKTPDIFLVVSDQVPRLANEGIISPVGFMDMDASKYAEISTKPFKVNGKYYGAPRSIETLFVYYNKDLLEYPFETINQYAQFNQKMMSQGKYGLIGKLDQLYIAYGTLSGYGAYIFKQNADGTYNTNDIGLNNQGAVDAVKMLGDYSKLYLPKDVLTPDGWGAVDTYFCEGKAAAVINGPWALGNYAKSGVNYGLAPLPKLANGNSMRPFYGSKGYAIAGNSKNHALAEKFVQFLNQPKYALIRYAAIAELPPIKAVLEDPLITNDDFANAIAIQVQSADAMPAVPELGKVWAPMGDALSDVINNGKDPKQACDEAVAKMK